MDLADFDELNRHLDDVLPIFASFNAEHRCAHVERASIGRYPEVPYNIVRATLRDRLEAELPKLETINRQWLREYGEQLAFDENWRIVK